MLGSHALSLKGLKGHLSSELSLRKASLPPGHPYQGVESSERPPGRGHSPGTWKKKKAEV